MVITETKLKGSYVIDIEKREDSRGFNARAMCMKEFEAAGLTSRFVQANILYNKASHTLRGFHYQTPPCAETKLFRCVRGRVFDVIIDLRVDSPTYMEWFGVELSAENYRMLYLPGNFAQGFLTLEDNTELFYQVTEFYSPGHEKGIRYNDPAFGVRWPAPVRVISAKDSAWPDYQDERIREMGGFGDKLGNGL